MTNYPLNNDLLRFPSGYHIDYQQFKCLIMDAYDYYEEYTTCSALDEQMDEYLEFLNNDLYERSAE